jgi:hypothetical protein
VDIWYTFSVLVRLDQEKSGNPGHAGGSKKAFGGLVKSEEGTFFNFRSTKLIPKTFFTSCKTKK